MEAIKSCEMLSCQEGVEPLIKNDLLISEEPVQFIYNGIPHLVMMCSPIDLEDLAYGFSFTEGIIHNLSQIKKVVVEKLAGGIALKIDIDPILMARLEGSQRKMSARTGCGVCGVENLSLVEKVLSPLSPVDCLSFSVIQKTLDDAQALQNYGHQTGASHAAFLCSRLGDILLVREDVGRHVALDKLVGAMLKMDLNKNELFVLMSSRASFEIVQKTIASQVPVLVTMSAPTDKAVQMAKKYNLQLWGFARKGRVNCYAT